MLQIRFWILVATFFCTSFSLAEKNSYSNCTTLTNLTTRYVGKRAICTQRAKCTLAAGASSEEGPTKNTRFICLPKGSDDSCEGISWQDCQADTHFPKDFDYANCVSETPGPTPLGCQLNATTAPLEITEETASTDNAAAVSSQAETAETKIKYLESKVKFKDAELTDKTLSTEERANRQIVRARRMQLILRSIGCQPSIILPQDPYGKPTSDEAGFNVSIENCVIKEKSADCGDKFEPRNIPGVQLIGYKACQKSGSAGSKSGAMKSTKSSTTSSAATGKGAH
jgi:hypothetical protein